jgi:hypothetical protein
MISDKKWFEMNLNPGNNISNLDFELPSLPPDEVQKAFTGISGKKNIEQAFAFYKFILKNCISKKQPIIMDFGSGWGRITRLFLRDTLAENIFAVDPYSVALDWMYNTKLPCRIIKSNPLPPIPEIGIKKFDLIYAFSVFSHLSEEYFNSWMFYLLSLLDEKGTIVFTTRGMHFINYIEKNEINKNIFKNYKDIKTKYNSGEFQFFGHKRSDELDGSWYGEAFIPFQYLEEKYRVYKPRLINDIHGVDQTVFALTKQ